MSNDTRALVYALDGVIVDVEAGNRFDATCLATVKRVRAALAQQPAGDSAKVVKPERDDFLQGICVALQVVTAMDCGVTWSEIVRSAGIDDLLHYATFVEPAEWELAGFARYAKVELHRARPRKPLATPPLTVVALPELIDRLPPAAEITHTAAGWTQAKVFGVVIASHYGTKPDDGEPDCASLVARINDAHRAYAAQPALPPAVGASTETAWLIEWKAHGYGPQWWGFSHTPGKHSDWCSDASKAIRFARREDAERVRLHVIASEGHTGNHDRERSIIVTEHEWIAAPPALPRVEGEPK
jgi:hypothetical protein